MKSPQSILVAVVAALGALLMRPAAAQTSNSVFYVDPNTQAARWVTMNQSDSRMPVIRDRIASVPQGRWFTQNNTPLVAAQVSSYVGAAAAAGKIPIMIVYNIPNRDCGGLSSGGIPDHGAYRAWIDQVAAGLQNRPATIILEPDVLPIMSSCLSASQQAETRASIAYAGKRLKAGSSQARVYFDIGHSNWLSPSEAASRLVASDIANSADGISTNVSNYRSTSAEVSYAKQIIAATGISRLQASSTPVATATGRWAPSGAIHPAVPSAPPARMSLAMRRSMRSSGSSRPEKRTAASAKQANSWRSVRMTWRCGRSGHTADGHTAAVGTRCAVGDGDGVVGDALVGGFERQRGCERLRHLPRAGVERRNVHVRGQLDSDHIHELGAVFEHDVPVSGAGARRGRQYVELYLAGRRHDLGQ